MNNSPRDLLQLAPKVSDVSLIGCNRAWWVCVTEHLHLGLQHGGHRGCSAHGTGRQQFPGLAQTLSVTLGNFYT